MKVAAINFKPVINRNLIGYNHKPQLTTPNQTNLAPELIFRQMSQTAYRPLSFGGNNFESTVEDNYFQLPASAKADSFQLAAAQNIYLDNDVLVTAPTGTGKTAIAHYAITKNLQNNEKTFYTTPLKALSNEKFRDFQRIYGEENVGILTGDTKINKDAPIMIMTTEVYRNMVFGDKFDRHNELLDGLKTVIFDELHYLGDVDRGGIWEQSIFLSDPDTQLVSLSATIGNNKEIANWMAKTKQHETPEIITGTNEDIKNYKASESMPVHTVLVDVPPENRHVPLKFENIVINAETEDNEAPKAKKKSKAKAKFNEQQQRLTNLARKKGIIPAYAYVDVVRELHDKDRLPAIFFVFDKRNSKDILEHLTKYGAKLTTDEEKLEIRKIIESYEQAGKYLGESLDVKALMKGYAVHNAGLLPTQKELIEELFQKKLVKVVIATETLSAGINMPTRTTVITASRKPSSNPDGDDNKRSLTANEFHQMAGRAGRRGLDKIGYCYTLSMDEKQADNFARLIKSNPNNLKSAFKPDYSFIAKYHDACRSDEMLDLICDKSFFAFNENEKLAEKNKQNLKNTFNNKIDILKQLGYLSLNNALTTKGKLIANLNGYEQIPVMEMVDSRIFKDMNPIELAATVGALANIADKKEKKHQDLASIFKQFRHENKTLEHFMHELDKTVSEYNTLSTQKDRKFHLKEANEELTKNIYRWAELNSVDDDSINNWARIYYNADKQLYKDEGTLFKGIMMTVDLLKQLQTMSKQGSKIATSIEERQYYYDLYNNITNAINLINREPAIG